MAKKIINSARYLTSKTETLSADNFGYLLIVLIILSSVLYIASLNLAISEGFHQERLRKDIRILGQEVQEQEEFFILTLRSFYEANASSFVATESSDGRLHFVNRRENVALNQTGQNTF
jgi:hypothetical protein